MNASVHALQHLGNYTGIFLSQASCKMFDEMFGDMLVLFDNEITTWNKFKYEFR